MGDSLPPQIHRASCGLCMPVIIVLPAPLQTRYIYIYVGHHRTPTPSTRCQFLQPPASRTPLDLLRPCRLHEFPKSLNENPLLHYGSHFILYTPLLAIPPATYPALCQILCATACVFDTLTSHPRCLHVQRYSLEHVLSTLRWQRLFDCRICGREVDITVPVRRYA